VPQVNAVALARRYGRSHDVSRNPSGECTGPRRESVAWRSSGPGLERPGGLVATSVGELERHLGGCFFVAAEEEEIVGFVFGVTRVNRGEASAVFDPGGSYVEIEELYVVPARRSSGVGSLLLGAVVDWANTQGVRYLSAYSATRDFESVVRFYKSCGFETWSVQMFRDLGCETKPADQAE
jgi:GNAT superfamily N-acetyltransferase